MWKSPLGGWQYVLCHLFASFSAPHCSSFPTYIALSIIHLQNVL